MPRTWIYYIALILPLVFSILILRTGFVENLWYRGHEDLYYALSALKVSEAFKEFMGGWALPVFTITILSYWSVDYDDETIAHQFLLLPLAYVPFSILGAVLSNWNLDPSLFYIHPLVVIPAGYLYLLPWIVFVAVFSKLRLVM